MNDVDFPVQRVLDGIDAAAAAGLPVKVNAVVKRGVNDAGVVELAEHFRGTGHVLRFIEFMDVGTTNGWRLEDVVTGRRDRRADRRALAARARRRREPRRDRAPLPLRRRRRRDRRDRLRHEAVLRRAARGRASRPRAASTRASLRPAATISAPRSAAARPTRSSPRRSATSGRGAPTATPSSAPPRPRRKPKVEMSYIGG